MSKQLNRPPTKQERKKDRRDEQRRQEAARLQAAKRRRTTLIGLTTGVVVLALVLSVYFFVIAPNNSANGQTGSATNASAPTGSLAPVIDNIGCYANEGSVLHYHVHVSITINGTAAPIPAQIGIPQTSDPNNACLYWIHTHDTTGVLHIESPVQRDFTFGNFLHIWHQQFAQLQYPLQLDSSSGWTVYVNGQPYTGDFYNLKMTPHMLITMGYQSPGIQPETTYNWGGL